MGHGRCAVATLLPEYRGKTVVIAAVGMSLQRVQHLLDQIVNIQKLQLGGRVVDGQGQIVRGIVAEGRHGAVVVGAAPFAEQIGEAVHQHRGAGLFCVGKE